MGYKITPFKMKKIDRPIKRLWQYKHDDKRTWMYSDFNVTGSTEQTMTIHWVRNPEFGYGHIVKEQYHG